MSRELLMGYKSEYDLSNDQKQIIKIIEEILPPKVESRYAKLLEDVSNYFKVAQNLRIASETVDVNSGKINGLKARMDSLTSSLDDSKRSLMHAVSQPDASWPDIAVVATKAEKMSFELDRVKDRLDARDNTQALSENTINEDKENLNKIILSMLDSVNSVNQLQIDGKDRLDNLSIQDKHIEKIPKRNQEKQRMYEKFIRKYISILVNTYKLSNDYAHKIIEGYKKRELVYSNESVNNSYPTYNKEEVVATIFDDLNNQFSSILDNITFSNNPVISVQYSRWLDIFDKLVKAVGADDYDMYLQVRDDMVNYQAIGYPISYMKNYYVNYLNSVINKKAEELGTKYEEAPTNKL